MPNCFPLLQPHQTPCDQRLATHGIEVRVYVRAARQFVQSQLWVIGFGLSRQVGCESNHLGLGLKADHRRVDPDKIAPVVLR